MNTHRTWPIAASVLLCIALSSCRSTPTRTFTLYAVAPASVLAYAGLPLRIDAVHVPPALDRIEMVTGIAPEELKISDVNRWSAPLGQAARQALSADMVARLPPGAVIFPGLPKPAGALGVSVDLLEFTTESGTAHLNAAWIVTPAGAEPPRGTPVALRTTLRGTDAPATARALSELLAQLADHIAADLK